MTIQHRLPDLIWAGTSHSLACATSAYNRMMDNAFDTQPTTDPCDPEDDCCPDNYEVQGGVGIVCIKGGLTNSDSWMNQYCGLVSYNSIREALIYGAMDTSVQAILLDIDSGGGSVSGCSDTANLVRQISDNVKPVYTCTSGTMASAAYWIGSAAKKTYCGDTSVVGSIGVLLTHMEYSKAFKDAGIGATVLRAGEFKALLNSVEPMSAKAKAQAEEQLQGTYDVFISAVAGYRGTTKAFADQTMGQGREFLGIKAVESGLVDGVMSFDKVLSTIQASLDKQPSTPSNSGNFNLTEASMKRALTEREIAALAAGAPVASAAAAAAAAVVPTQEPQSQDAAKPPVEPVASAPAGAVAEPVQNEVVVYLQKQLQVAQSELVQLRVDVANKDQKLVGMLAVQTGLIGIAAQSTRNMRVALGLPLSDFSAMAAEALVAEHSATSKQFTDSFKAGPVAAPSETSADAGGGSVDPLRMKRLKATAPRQS